MTPGSVALGVSLARAMAFFCDFVSLGTTAESSGKSMSLSVSLSSLLKPASRAAVWSSSTASSSSPSTSTAASTASSTGSSCAFFPFFALVALTTGASTASSTTSTSATGSFLPFFALAAFALGASFLGVSFFASITSKSSMLSSSSSSPLVSGAGAGSAFFLPLAALGALVGFTAGASSSDMKSSAVLRADFLEEGAGAALAALGDLAGFAGAGAAMSSDFLGFFALGAVSDATADC